MGTLNLKIRGNEIIKTKKGMFEFELRRKRTKKSEISLKLELRRWKTKRRGVQHEDFPGGHPS